MPTGSKTIEYVVCDDRPTLVWLANLADLELHTSLSRAEDIRRPTTLAFDLDPGEPATIVECCRVGLLLEGMFRGLGLESFPKTSGSKGLQVYVPLNSPTTYDVTKGFAKAVAELLEREEPELVVSRQTKTLRRGKVLVDWSQNDEHKTTVNVYSLRARERPTVSTPLTWDEVREGARARRPGAARLRRRRGPRAGRGARRPLRAGRVACAAAARGLTLRSVMRRRRRTLRELLAELRLSPDEARRRARRRSAWRRCSTRSAARAMTSASARRPRSRPSAAAGTTFSRRTRTSRPPRPACSPAAGTAGCSSGSRGR